MSGKTNSQLIQDELWKVVKSVGDKTLTSGEADAITNAVGKMVQVAFVEIKSKELGIDNPLDNRGPKQIDK